MFMSNLSNNKWVKIPRLTDLTSDNRGVFLFQLDENLVALYYDAS